MLCGPGPPGELMRVLLVAVGWTPDWDIAWDAAAALEDGRRWLGRLAACPERRPRWLGRLAAFFEGSLGPILAAV